MISIPGTLRDGGTLADGTRKLYVYTQEVSPEQLFEVIKESGKIGYFFFSPRVITQEQIDKMKLPEPKLESSQRSPSERLRSCIFVLWEQEKPNMTFDQFYAYEMEKNHIEKVKARLL